MNVLIITSGWLPVPAVNGGAVESLVDYIIDENERQDKISISVLSCYDKKAKEKESEYKNTNFFFVKYPIIVKIMDYLLYNFAKYVLKKKKVMTYYFIFKRLWLAHKSKHILLRGDYDKVIIENHVSQLLPFKNKKVYEKYKNKLIYHEHNVINNDIGCKDILLYCNKIVTVSDYISREFENKYPEYNSNKIVKLANVADLSRFGKGDIEYQENLKKQLNIKNNEIIFMFAGRLDETKGVLETIQAFNKLNRKNAKLVIVGSYAYQTKTSNGFDFELHNLVKNQENVVFTGFIDFDKMPSLYKMADVMVLPSIWDDPAPLSIIESLCSGCALITTKSGGIPEYASDLAIVLERDINLIDNIAKSMQYLMDNESERERLKKRAWDATRSWSTEAYFNNFYSIISEN